MNNNFAFKKIHASKLFVDTRYQRPVSTEKVNSMAKNWDNAAVGVLIVSERPNGMYAIIDGQHRFEAGKRVGIEYFSCVSQAVEYTKEADLFHKINVKRGIVKSALQFKASLEAEHEKPVHIKSIVESNGFKFEFVKAAQSQNMIACVAELLKAYDVGAHHLDLVLKTLRDAYNGNKKSLTYYFVEGMSSFLKKYIIDIDYKRFLRLLKEHPIDLLINDAKRTKDRNSERLGTSLEKELLKLYNKGLRNKIEQKNRDDDNKGGAPV